MKSDVLVHDVFLSMAPADRGVAEIVRRALEERGLRVFVDEQHLPDGTQWEDGVGPAMAESQAFVGIISQASLNSPWKVMEVGAAQAWGKAIFLLLVGLTEVPAFLNKYPAVPISQLSEVVADVAQSIQPLSDQQLEILKALYVSQDLPSDQLGVRPDVLTRLTNRFNRKASTRISPERLRQELVRMRKRGELPRRKRKTG